MANPGPDRLNGVRSGRDGAYACMVAPHPRTRDNTGRLTRAVGVVHALGQGN